MTVPSRVADPGWTTAWSGPALTVGAWFTGPPGPVVNSTWSRGAVAAPDSKASAVRRPVPENCRASALPCAQPDLPTTDWTTAQRFGVRCAVEASPTVFQGGGVHAVLTGVVVREVTLPETAW